MRNCKHERWLYAPVKSKTLDDNNFLCADCGQWIKQASIEYKKIVNVVHEEPAECKHDIKFYTLSSQYLCLRCGHTWYPEPAKLTIKADADYEDKDKSRRQKILAEYNTGDIQGIKGR